MTSIFGQPGLIPSYDDLPQLVQEASGREKRVSFRKKSLLLKLFECFQVFKISSATLFLRCWLHLVRKKKHSSTNEIAK